jgi:hypothetical protein
MPEPAATTETEAKAMSNVYHETISKMEAEKVNQDYIIGWAGGYQDNPQREEQRINEAYSAGYEDGKARKTDGYAAWVGK